jgi:hypothetical protein
MQRQTGFPTLQILSPLYDSQNSHGVIRGSTADTEIMNFIFIN